MANKADTEKNEDGLTHEDKLFLVRNTLKEIQHAAANLEGRIDGLMIFLKKELIE